MNPNVLINLHYNYHYSISVIADIYRCDINVVKSCFNNLGIKIFGAKTASSTPPAIYKDHNFEMSLSIRARRICTKYINPVVLYREMVINVDYAVVQKILKCIIVYFHCLKLFTSVQICTRNIVYLII